MPLPATPPVETWSSSRHGYPDTDSPTLSSDGPGSWRSVHRTGKHVPRSHPAKGSAPRENQVLGWAESAEAPPTLPSLTYQCSSGVGGLVSAGVLVPVRPSWSRQQHPQPPNSKGDDCLEARWGISKGRIWYCCLGVLSSLKELLIPLCTRSIFLMDLLAVHVIIIIF